MSGKAPGGATGAGTGGVAGRSMFVGSAAAAAVGLIVTLAVSPAHAAAPADPPPAPPPLSQGRPATASSETGPATVAGAAVDGDVRSRWQGAPNPRAPQWISIDLGAMSTVNRVTLQWGGRNKACANEYRLQTSADGIWWTDVYTTVTGHGGTENISLTGYGRFVRAYLTRPCHRADGYALAEFQVYGSTGVVDPQAPTAPTNARGTAVTATSVTLAWDPASDNVGVTAYDIYQTGTLVKSVDGGTLSTSVTKLNPVTTYGFYVNARDAAGNVSQASNTVSATTPVLVVDKTPPSPPVYVRATAVTANSVTLTWDPATDDIGVTGYTVYNGQPAGGTAVVTTTGNTVAVQGLAPRTAYTFTVVAADAAGNRSPAGAGGTVTTRAGRDPVGQVTPVEAGTDVPWGLDFLPDGSGIMTERDTHDVVKVAPDGTRTVAGTVPDVSGTDGEGGLLGIQVSPAFATDHWLYIFHTTATDNRIVRIRYVDDKLDLTSEQVLLSGILRNKFHNAGRLRFGPDGKLYAATGDAQNGANAQNLNSLNGKVLRLNPDGTVPADNPFPGKYVWSYGHRNIEGLAFDSKGRLWEAELGNSIMDELNLIRKGANYGWPACEGTAGWCGDLTFVAPKQTWPVAVASPSGLAIVDDTLYMAALRGMRMYRMRISGDGTQAPESYFQGTYGRLRTVEPAPDGSLWLTTSNNGDKDSIPNNSSTQILRVDLRHR